MASTERHGRVTRLVLQIARDAVNQSHLKTLLTAANATIAGHRQELQMAKARLATGDVRGAGRPRVK
jgi:outer membrane protein TolC